MFKKKLTKILAVSALIIGGLSMTVFAIIPGGTAVIGDKAYDLNYLPKAATEENKEITQHIVAGKEIYVKDFGGNWVKNSDGTVIKNASEVIPPVTYKDQNGKTTKYEKGDGAVASDEEFYVVDIN